MFSEKMYQRAFKFSMILFLHSFFRIFPVGRQMANFRKGERRYLILFLSKHTTAADDRQRAAIHKR